MDTLSDLLRRIDEHRAALALARPLTPDQLSLLRSYFQVGLTYSSNALEGNTLTESETKVVIEDGLTVGGKSLREHIEASGHAAAFSHLVSLARNATIEERDVLMLHRLYYQGIDPEAAGRYRTRQVIISGSRFPLPPPEEIPQRRVELFSNVDAIRATHHPVVAAALLHKDFVFIHPFVDGNGRVARLLMNLSLLQDGFLPAIIPPLRRIDYITSLEGAHLNEAPFIELIAAATLDTATDFARLLHVSL